MKRLASYSSVPGWRAALERANSPMTSCDPFCGTKSTDGVMVDPSAFTMTSTSPSLKLAMQEKVVPKSMPTAVTGGLGIMCWSEAASSTTIRLKKMAHSEAASIVLLERWRLPSRGADVPPSHAVGHARSPVSSPLLLTLGGVAGGGA
eukprot:scaffold47242_cov35-Tisochrysis_lutea.AAC.1